MKKPHKNHYQILLYLLLSSIIITGCDKQNEWLDVKNNKSSVVPQTIKDFQAILDNTNSFNNAYSTAGLVGADNYYLTDVRFNASDEEARNLYSWNKKIWRTESSGHWSVYFRIIEYANVVLEGLEKINKSEYNYNNVKGQALFHRAMAYYNLCQLFCKAYSTSSDSELGLPIRLNADVNNIVQRANLTETYHQILNDASEASSLLPDVQPYVQRPINAAAMALLAKTYLNMDDYKNAEIYSGKCIAIRPQLLDFNNSTVANINTTYRFPAYAKNIPEVLFYAESSQYSQISAITSNTGIVTAELYTAYAENDLRKTLFYAISSGDIKFRGTYTGRIGNFCGIATNEVYLIQAECNARLSQTDAAMRTLNSLLINRYKTGTFMPLTALNPEEALSIILQERRKELPFVANIRWEDLKRLNKESQFQKTLTRVINGVTYTLTPGNIRYVFPIPQDEIRLSGIQQNDR